MVSYATDSVMGTTHVENQDGFLVVDEPDYILLFIFDGVSRSLNPKKGVDTAIDYISKNHRAFVSKDSFDLKALMYEVQQCILHSNWEDALTTYCAACILKKDTNTIIVSNLGDSRVYLLGSKDALPVTNDDTLYPGSNILTKCLGIERIDRDDFRVQKIQREKKRILLCTDGFYSFMEEERTYFINVLNLHEISEIKNLIKEKLEGKNIDDATYIIAFYK